ncbi:hypothetical protein AC1031_018349 [Aphanomyces cochlioides]|nr:hypothetical protein AC1031_018349 [Aphanomyces cochlioides]
MSKSRCVTLESAKATSSSQSMSSDSMQTQSPTLDRLFGPFQASSAFLLQASLLVRAFDLFEGARSVYTLDRRGTGSSSFLSCESDVSNSDNFVECYTQCFNGIHSKFSNGVAAAFSTTSAARDVASLVQSSLFESTQVYLYGFNYGSYLAECVMHFAPSRVKGYILDNPQLEEFSGPSAPYYSNRDRLGGEVVAQVLALYDSDDFCASKMDQAPKKPSNASTLPWTTGNLHALPCFLHSATQLASYIHLKL